jgi:hypothetical protein
MCAHVCPAFFIGFMLFARYKGVNISALAIGTTTVTNSLFSSLCMPVVLLQLRARFAFSFRYKYLHITAPLDASDHSPRMHRAVQML